MLIQKGLDWNLQFSVLDSDPSAPCHTMASFKVGKLTDFETVMQFGASCDVITIEIENVNTAALRKLEQGGKKIYPQPSVIEMIQDKRTQKQFFVDHGIPTADFVLTENREDLRSHLDLLPAVHKLGREGYDGRGVQILRAEEDLPKAFDVPGVLERFVDFEHEIAVIVARNERGDVACFPAVEMSFHPDANLVEHIFSPAGITPALAAEAELVAKNVVKQLGIIGLLAVEMFTTKNGQVIVNEIAPRPHNSGHQTIEGNATSQYEQHLRAILNLPLGDTSVLRPSAMVNLLGAPDYDGPAQYLGIEKILKMEGVHVHLYGKMITRPFRKMGHVTIVDDDIESLKKKVNFVKDNLKVIS